MNLAKWYAALRAPTRLFSCFISNVVFINFVEITFSFNSISLFRCFLLNIYKLKHFFFQAEDGIRDAQESRGLGDVYKRQVLENG